jgi:hypothetical protein
MKLNGKKRLLVVLTCMVFIFTLTTASKPQDQRDLDSLCYNAGICEGYTSVKLHAISGGDMFSTDQKFVRLPKGASFSSSIPFCSIYEYDTSRDDDAAWQCTWEEFNGIGGAGYFFRLTSINARDNSSATIEAIAGVIDTKVFKLNDNWVFKTSNRTSHALTAKSHPQNSITLYSVDTYYTDGDDDFTFSLYEMNDEYNARTENGGKNSYIHGRIFNITPPSTMFACQSNIRLNNNNVFWESRGTNCPDLNYSKQYPLIVPSIYSYDFPSGYVDKDFAFIMNSFGLETYKNKTWATLSASMKYGDKYDIAWIQMTILGYR